MIVPGSNLLGLALTVIAPQAVQYLAFTGRTRDAAGKYTNNYAAPVDIQGSFQSVERRSYEKLGLDLAKSYRQLFAVPQVFDVTRGTAGDRVVYGGRLYEAVGESDWNLQDGWQGTLFVDVGPVDGN